MCDPRHLDPRPGLSGEVPDECRQAPIPVLRASLRQIGVMAARHDPAQHASQTPPVRRLNNDNEFSVRQAGIKGLTIVPAMIQRPPWPAPLRCARETLPRPAPAIPDANIACPGAARAARGAGKCNGLGARPGNGLLALHVGNGLRGRARGTFSCGELCEVVSGADQPLAPWSLAHSQVTFSTPRRRSCRKLRAASICPNTGSTICLRSR